MTYPRFHMTHEEQTDTTSRAISVLTSGQGDQVSLALGDTFLDLSLADLAFIARCANMLPAGLLDQAVQSELQQTPPQDAQDDDPKPKRHGQRWTDEEDRQMLEAMQAGVPPREIATILDRSPASIASRLLALGAVDVEPNPEKVAELLETERE